MTHKRTERSWLGALRGAFSALRDRLALTRWLLGGLWLGRRRQELPDGRLEALLRDRLGLLLARPGHEEKVAEPTEAMIEAAYWTLRGFSKEHDDTEETIRALFLDMEAARVLDL